MMLGSSLFHITLSKALVVVIPDQVLFVTCAFVPFFDIIPLRCLCFCFEIQFPVGWDMNYLCLNIYTQFCCKSSWMVVVNFKRHFVIIKHFFKDYPRSNLLFNRNNWFQKNIATVPIAGASMNFVKELFPDKIISRLSDISLTVWTPDLSPFDFLRKSDIVHQNQLRLEILVLKNIIVKH